MVALNFESEVLLLLVKGENGVATIFLYGAVIAVDTVGTISIATRNAPHATLAGVKRP